MIFSEKVEFSRIDGRAPRFERRGAPGPLPREMFDFRTGLVNFQGKVEFFKGPTSRRPAVCPTTASCRASKMSGT